MKSGEENFPFSEHWFRFLRSDGGGQRLFANRLICLDYLKSQGSVTLPGSRIGTSPRIGIDYAGSWTARPLRFFMVGNPHVSRTRPRATRACR